MHTHTHITLHAPDETYFRSYKSETKSLCNVPRSETAILDWYDHVLVSNGAQTSKMWGHAPQE